MPKKATNKPTTIPKCNTAFRKWIKQMKANDLKNLSKEKMQKIYDRALEAYPDSGVQISRKERENLYAVQEALLGKLDPKLQASLENVGKTLATKPDKRKQSIDYNLPKPGAVIVKSFKDKQLEVKVLKSGFEYEGQKYSSLSKLAQKIAGYAVSGPIFFGLRQPKTKVG